ncbi:hypothetical protein [Maricaulis sp.]|jgi:uncharacterized membrane protein YvlD (DUF360 family)|uniref:hypothetical protein n=1 Tax=Maricaulis sp. TaxID=1486257 RepID=UPI00261C46BB|nr:hypothetical protein [Maricaulis sp.]MDF1769873.1 hypothetical protein [Maricaulis sp.]
MIDPARAWQRPLFSGVITVCILWVTSKVPPESAVAALTAFLVAGAVLYFIRGVVDKDKLTEWLRIWRGNQ